MSDIDYNKYSDVEILKIFSKLDQAHEFIQLKIVQEEIEKRKLVIPSYSRNYTKMNRRRNKNVKQYFELNITSLSSHFTMKYFFPLISALAIYMLINFGNSDNFIELFVATHPYLSVFIALMFLSSILYQYYFVIFSRRVKLLSDGFLIGNTKVTFDKILNIELKSNRFGNYIKLKYDYGGDKTRLFFLTEKKQEYLIERINQKLSKFNLAI